MKILFVHNTAMPYRLPFFKKVSEIYNVKFIFTRFERSFKRRGMSKSHKIGVLEDSCYDILKNRFLFENIIRLIPKLLKEDYDVIVGSIDYIPPSAFLETLLCYIASKIKNKPIIFWSEEWGWPKHPLRRLISPFINFVIRNCDAIVVPGGKHKEYLISLGALPDKVFIMPNVTNLSPKQEDYIRRDKFRMALGLKNKKVVLYVGQLRRLKGIHYLISAFAKLKDEIKDVVLIIIGTGKYKKELLKYCKMLNLSKNDVYFLGFVKNEELGAYYLLSNVFVIPSIFHRGFADACPLVVNEAIYFGKPVIATDAVGAAFDMIKDGENGFMVPEKDSEALYEAMKKILSDPELEKRMGEESKRIIEEGFRYEHMIEGFKDAIKCVSKKGLKNEGSNVNKSV